MTFTLPQPGTANPDFAQPADAERLEHTADALRQRGFQVTIAESGDRARQLVLDALPEGAEVHTGLSETLQQIGLLREDSIAAVGVACDTNEECRSGMCVNHPEQTQRFCSDVCCSEASCGDVSLFGCRPPAAGPSWALRCGPK